MTYTDVMTALLKITDAGELRSIAQTAQNRAASVGRQSLRVLQHVEFDARGETHRGQVIAIGPKNAKVQVGKMKWTVNPALLRVSGVAVPTPPAVRAPPKLPEFTHCADSDRYPSRF
jgi:hypothetical protein